MLLFLSPLLSFPSLRLVGIEKQGDDRQIDDTDR
jgi:hypothetical protein